MVIDAAEKMLPRVGDRTAAREILSNSKLREKLITKIKIALERRNFNLHPTNFIDDNFPEVSLLMPALISRLHEKPDLLLEEFQALKNGAQNRLSEGSDLVSNNLFGCVNAIYLDASQSSILFSGFTVFILMARGNIRHFLELIHRVFNVHEAKNDENLPEVSPRVQSNAVRDASESILATVSGYGIYGSQLYALAFCLGSIFRERHRNEKQSEPEINHFTLASGDIDKKLQRYLDEAEKWSVLYRSRETKMKSPGSINSDYTLNPIFSPYFQISFRKKRSLAITAAQLLHMFEGEQHVRDRLVRELGRQDFNSNQGDLFGIQYL
jgi:hypothetical protein